MKYTLDRSNREVSIAVVAVLAAIVAMLMLAARPAYAATGLPGLHSTPNGAMPNGEEFGYGGNPFPPGIPPKVDELLKTVPASILARVGSLMAGLFGRLGF